MIYILIVLRLKPKIKLTLTVPLKGFMKLLRKSVMKHITVDNHYHLNNAIKVVTMLMQ